MDLAHRNVVVTGGASGIGRAMCRAFARQGIRGIVVADLNGDGARTVADELSDQGFPAIAVPTDVTDESQVTALVAAVRVGLRCRGCVLRQCRHRGARRRGAVR